MRKKRYNYTPEEKILILKRHIVEHVAVSDLCDEYQLQPKVFYDWQKRFFENERLHSFVKSAAGNAPKKPGFSSWETSCGASMRCSRN